MNENKAKIKLINLMPCLFIKISTPLSYLVNKTGFDDKHRSLKSNLAFSYQTINMMLTYKHDRNSGL